MADDSYTLPTYLPTFHRYLTYKGHMYNPHYLTLPSRSLTSKSRFKEKIRLNRDEGNSIYLHTYLRYLRQEQAREPITTLKLLIYSCRISDSDP